MLKKIVYFIYSTTFILLLLSSCKKLDESTIQPDKVTSKRSIETMVVDVKSWYDSTIKSNSIVNSQNIKISMSSNLNDIKLPVIDWNKAYINFDSSNVKSLTVPISNNYTNGESLQLVTTKYKNKTNGFFIKITPDSIYFKNQINYYDYTNFSGSISIYNLIGQRLKIQNFNSGVVTKVNNTNKVAQSNSINLSTESPCDGCELYTVIVYNSKKRDYSYNYGLIYISDIQNIQLDGFGGVIAGGIGEESLDGINYYYQFPLKSDYVINYPKFTELIKNIYQNSLKNPKILDWLKTYSHMTDAQIYEAMKFNQGPIIIITDLNDPNTYNGPYRYGKYNLNEQKIYIDIKTIKDFENGVNFSFEAYTLFLSATILHETVHYGNNLNNFNEGKFEYGIGFEIAAFGSIVELKNK